MALDGYFINKLVIEINEKLLNNRLEKIFQVEKDIFIFSFYYQKERNFLYFKLNSPNASFFISNEKISNENTTSNFLNLLKQNLEGYILKSIEQKDFDRVVTFSFEGNDLLDGKVEKSLVLELMGRHNNLILLNDNIIIDAYIKKFSPDSRSVLPKIKFEYFPTTKTIFTNSYDNVDNNLYLSKNFMGISPLFSKYLYNNRLVIDDIKVNPTKNMDNNQFYWFDLFKESDTLNHYNSLSELLESNLTLNITTTDKYYNFVNKELIRYTKIKESIVDKLALANENLNYKDSGDAIYSSGIKLNSYLPSITDYNDNIIKLDPLLTLNENAQAYYKKYQKAKRTITHLESQLIDYDNLINIFNQFEFDLSSSNQDYLEIEHQLKSYGYKVKRKKQAKNNTKKINVIKLEYNDAIFYVGKNNYQNEYITHTLGKHNDYWFHIKDAPGSHVLLKGNLNDTNLEFAAMLAGEYSKENLTPVVSINYTQIKNVKKIPKMPGYQVILKSFNTISVRIDKSLINHVFVANHLKK